MSSSRPNLLTEDTLKKVKDIIIGTRAAGGVISRRMVIAIGIGVVKANDPNILKEYGGQVELTEGWARGVLSTLNWTKRKGRLYLLLEKFRGGRYIYLPHLTWGLFG